MIAASRTPIILAMHFFKDWIPDHQDGSAGSRYSIDDDAELPELLRPETPLEERLLEQPEFVHGLMWGQPRFGHPEGKVALHIREVFDNIDRLHLPTSLRLQLRLIALVHDTFKYQEAKTYPRDWSNHHGVLARRFLENFTQDNAVLTIVELHDEAYYAWRTIHLYKKTAKGEARLHRLLLRLGDNLPLFYLFFLCDTRTGDKNLAPLRWFEQAIPEIQAIPL